MRQPVTQVPDLGPLFADLHDPPVPPSLTLEDLAMRPGWMTLEPFARSVAKYLFVHARGSEKARTAGEIVRWMREGSTRDVRAATEALSKAGFGEICSSTHAPMGYFWAMTAEEVARYQVQLRSRLRRLQLRLRAAERAEQRLLMEGR